MRHAIGGSLHVALSGMSGQNCLELVSNALDSLVNAPIFDASQVSTMLDDSIVMCISYSSWLKPTHSPRLEA